LRIVVDTCVFKLATFPSSDNPSALIAELALRGMVESWVSPAILDEYSRVLSQTPEFLAELLVVFETCYPITTLNVIRHEPDNRFAECALAVGADFLVTVNTARGHFDRKRLDEVRIVTPGEFVSLPAVQPLLAELAHR
jgi:predicted nucleic acid-binding protein